MSDEEKEEVTHFIDIEHHLNERHMTCDCGVKQHCTSSYKRHD